MSIGLFIYPKQAFFGKFVPKNKIYANAKVSNAIKRKFNVIEKITWQYKLSPETINLPARGNIHEIEVFSISLREPELHKDVLRLMDNAIPFPVIYELVYNGRVKAAAAFKRPSDADSNKWVTDIYFESGWHSADIERESLPTALDIGGLYEQMLRRLMPISGLEGEDIRQQTERLSKIRSLEAAAVKLEAKLKREKQFNRKVEINAELRELRKKVRSLSDT